MYEEQRLTIPATGKHDWSDWWIVKKSTVFKTGTKKRECWICDKTQTVSIPKLKPFVKLNKKTISLTAGKSYRLKASYAKGDSVKKCKSSNKKVATVSKKGVISGFLFRSNSNFAGCLFTGFCVDSNSNFTSLSSANYSFFRDSSNLQSYCYCEKESR